MSSSTALGSSPPAFTFGALKLLVLVSSTAFFAGSACRVGVIKDFHPPPCTEGALECLGEDRVLVCLDGELVLSHFCPAETHCVAGQCEPIGTCEPDCVDRDCGDDGCQGSCGSCISGFHCVEGICEPDSTCEPDCVGRDCGDDGCQGSCGTCEQFYECNAQGVCVATTPQCGDGACDPTQGETCQTCPGDCDNAPWGNTFVVGQTVYDFLITGYADTSGDHVVEQVEVDFSLSQMACAGYKSVLLVWNDWCPT